MDLKICSDSDIKEGQTIKFEIQSGSAPRDGVLLRKNGELKAFYNECPHIGLALDWDDNDFFSSDGSQLVCKNHGATFDPSTGDCLQGPCQGIGLKPIEIEVLGNLIFAKV